MLEHFEQYCDLRDQGYSVWNAAYEVGVSDETGMKYERTRKKLEQGETLAVTR